MHTLRLFVFQATRHHRHYNFSSQFHPLLPYFHYNSGLFCEFAMTKFALIALLSLPMFFATAAERLTFSLNRLQNGDAVTVSEADFADKFLLIAVGFTGCPDICPTTMLDYKNALKALDKHPQQAKKLQPLFITIDPLSDSLQDINDYAAFFDPRIVGLRAENFEKLDDVVSQLHASYGYIYKGKPVFPPDLPKGYTVMHSAYIYLYSPGGELLDVFPYNMDGDTLASNILSYLSK
ncbi:MAG: SCO family protein [Gammaproteobacteria bacterium]|nr:MAG: SCO family protein [Gammaproteobacteria bacterium]